MLSCPQNTVNLILQPPAMATGSHTMHMHTHAHAHTYIKEREREREREREGERLKPDRTTPAPTCQQRPNVCTVV
jgi:hypothetical protein